MRNVALVAAISMTAAASMINNTANALDSGLLPGQVDPDRLWSLHESEFAILRSEGGQARPVGMGFVIRQSPLSLLTCYHVVSEGSESNDGKITYLIVRSAEDVKQFDFRKRPGYTLRIKRIVFKPEYDLAILQIDPADDPDASSKLRLSLVKAMEMDFRDQAQRAPGSAVMWLTTAAGNPDQQPGFLPRFFVGNIVSSYTADSSYDFTSASGRSLKQKMNGIGMLEVDKVMMPGASGGAVVNAATNKVIGYSHGLHHFPVIGGKDAEIQIAFGLVKISTPTMASLSRVIDLRGVYNYLMELGYAEK